MNNIRLTIGIPTYNRNEILIRSLEPLLPQVANRSDVELLIIDNCSDLPIQESINYAFSKQPNNLRVMRNRFNVGANENILRVIENANGEFVHVLGDDDHVTPDSVDTILSKLDKYPDAWFINFNTPLPGHTIRDKEYYYTDIISFLDGIDSFGQIMFISDGVFKASSLKTGFRFGCFYQNTCAPGFVTLLYSMKHNSGQGKVVLTNARIVDITTTASLETQLSIIPVIQGLTYLSELNLPSDVSHSLKRAISTTQNGWLTYKGFVRSLVYDLHQGQARTRIFAMHNSLIRRFFFLDQKKSRLLVRYLFSILLLSKTMTRVLLLLAGKITGRKFSLDGEKRSVC